METTKETIDKKADVNPLFQRENTTKIDEIIANWNKLPNCHTNMRKVQPPTNYPNMDKEPILMFYNKPVIWLEYRAGCWFGFSHYLEGHKDKDHKFPRVHNEEELKDMFKLYIEPRKTAIENQLKTERQEQQKKEQKAQKKL